MAQDSSYAAVREVVAKAVSEPSAVLKALGEPTRAGLHRIYDSPELTIINLIWAPLMTIYPHDHRMWAVIGIYSGREDNVFWRRTSDKRRVEAAGAKSISARDAIPLGPDIIHSVTNPIPRMTAAIHVYGGDFFKAERSDWDPESLCERPYSVERAVALFEAENALISA
jgi:predicted metal-dependent enzyme (double-stranded beta helix superfamily)